MKKIAFYNVCISSLSVLLLSLTLVNAQRGPVDFYDCSGKSDGNYVHPSDCTKFIACVAGIYAYEMDCVAGLNYDPVGDRCDWPSEVGCIIDPPSTTTLPTTTTPSTTTTSTTPPPTTTTSTTTPSTSSASSPSPVFDCSGLPDGNYKHPTNCSQFISCVAGEFAYEMDCPAGLHYDPRTDQCDYPEVAGCDPNYITTTPTTTTTTVSTTTGASSPSPVFDCSGLPDGNYKHPTNCSQFISCVAGEYAYEMDCPAGLHYDPRTDQCDYPEVAGCDPNYITTTSTTTTTASTTISTPSTSASSPSPVFDCSWLPDGNYKHPTNCSRFIACVAGQPYEMDCPAGLHFDPRTNQCDYPEIVGCDPNFTSAIPSTSTTTGSSSSSTSSTTPSQPTTTSQVPPPIFNCSGLPDGNYKHPTDCSKFISCVAGEYAYEMDCPEGLHYDPTTDQCDYPWIVECDWVTDPPPPPTTSEEPGTTTEEESETTQTGETETTPVTNGTSTTRPTNPPTASPDPDACDHDCQYVGIDCHTYYTCVNYTRKEYHQCSYELGLAFNPILSVCDRIENVPGCRPETTTDVSTTPEEECGCEYRPHETNCSRYYFCSNSCRRSSCQLLTCPGDLLWSVDLYGDGSAHQQCTLPERATCASQDSGSAHLRFSCYRKDDGMYRNEQDCHSYWRCNNGIALLYACPQGFIYNPEVKACDFPAKSLRFCGNNNNE